MKVYRIKHIPTGKYVSGTWGMQCEGGLTSTGRVFMKKCQNFDKFDKHPDYEILWDEIKD